MRATGSRFRTYVLGTTALVTLGSIAFGSNRAEAACSSFNPGPDETVLCSGLVGSPIATSDSGVTVIFDETTQFLVVDDVPVTLGDDGTIVLNGDDDSGARIRAQGAFAAGIEGGENLTINMNGMSSLEAVAGSASIGVYGRGGTMNLADESLIITEGRDQAFGVHLRGTGDVSIADSAGIVAISGDFASGLIFEGHGSTVTLNDLSAVVARVQYGAGVGAMALLAGGNDNTIVLNDKALLATASVNASSSFLAGIYGSGENLQVTLNDDAELSARVSGSYAGLIAGFVGFRGDEHTLTLNDNSRSTVRMQNGTESAYAYGILLGGGPYAVLQNSITLNGTSASLVGLSDSRTGSAAAIATARNNTRIALGDNSRAGVALSGNSEAGQVGGIRSLFENTEVTLSGQASVEVALLNADAGWVFGVAMGDLCGCVSSDQVMTLGDDAFIRIEIDHSDVDFATGAQFVGEGSQITLNGAAWITNYIAASTVGAAMGMTVMGNDNSITLNDMSTIGVGVSSSSSVSVNLTALTIAGDGNTVAINDNATLYLEGEGGVSSGISMAGDDNTITLSGNSLVDVNSGASGVGILTYSSDGGTITLGDNAIVRAGDGTAIHAQLVSNLTVNLGQGAAISGFDGIRTFAENSHFNISGLIYAQQSAIELSGSNNVVTLDTGAYIAGDIVATGDNALVLEGEGVLASLTSGFATLDVNAAGVWNLIGDVSVSDVFGSGAAFFNSGTVLVNGLLTAPGDLTVGADATLGGSGTIVGNVVNFGTVSPGNSPGTLNVVGDFDFAAGSSFVVEMNASAADEIVATGNIDIDPTATLQIVNLGGVDGFSGSILTAGGVVSGTFASVSGGAGAVSYSANNVTLTSMQPTSINGSLLAGTQTGFAFVDALNAQARAGLGGAGRLWVSGIAENTSRNSDGNGRSIDGKSRGMAFGGDLLNAGNMSLGLAAGYIDTTAESHGGGATTDISGYHLGAYGAWSLGNGFATGALTGSLQDHDTERRVLSGGAVALAEGKTDAWSVGAGFVAGHVFPLQGNWTLTPTVHAAWQRLERDGYSEAGGGAAGIGVNSVTAEVLKAGIGAELGVEIADPSADWSVRPSLRAGYGHEWQTGDSRAGGTFLASATQFSAVLDDRDQAVATAGAGIQASLGGGISGFANYDVKVGEHGRDNVFSVGARITW